MDNFLDHGRHGSRTEHTEAVRFRVVPSDFRAFRDPRKAGVTLIEMLVVVTLIGLLAAVVAPSVGSGVETVKLRSTAEKLSATMRAGRDRALRTHHYMQVSVDPQSRAVELRDLEAGSSSSWVIPDTIRVLSDKSMAFQLYPDGGAQAMRVKLQNERGRRVEVAMDPFTLFPSVIEVAQ